MTDLTIANIKNAIREELKDLYPERELLSLIKIILKETSGLPPTTILAYPETKLDAHVWHKINKICKDLKEFKPIQYILGSTEFFGLSLKVNKHTLIPRQETEELVALVVEENPTNNLRILDIGTGSGAIAISLCKNLPSTLIVASDISAEALEIAATNANNNKCDLEFIEDDILNSRLDRKGTFDIIVSNPPYVRESEKKQMSRNVLEFEPGSALFVKDNDPLLFYLAIARLATTLLKDKGKIYCEINEALANETRDLFKEEGFNNIRIIKDINNKDRIISADK